jgi:lipid-A-disaccharide synthase
LQLSGRQEFSERATTGQYMATARRVFISVCEDSADVHAASLLRCARELLPDCRFYGMTGPRMRALGAHTLYDFTRHAAMLSGVFSIIGHARRATRIVEHSWRERPPDLVLLLDSPELHLRFARRARQLGLPVLYYIAPQTWAAREYRNRRIARDVDRLACILPFEEEYFHASDVNAEFVGHPLFETLDSNRPDAGRVAELRAAGGPVLALLPGSRRHVIDAMLPRQLEVVRRLHERGLAVKAAISCVAEDRRALIEEHLVVAGLPASIVAGDNATLLTAADLVLVASGTAALEVAFYRKPMIVMYDAGRWLERAHGLVGRLILKLPHLSLLNILAGTRVVPEFMPFLRDTRPVAQVAARLIEDQAWRRLMIEQMDRAVQPLENSRPSERVCAIMAEMLGLEAVPVGARTSSYVSL